MDALDAALHGALREGLRPGVIVEMRPDKLLEGGDLFADGVEDVLVVAEVHQERGLPCADVRQELFDHADEEIELRAGAADGHEIAPGRALLQAVETALAVELDVLHKLVVDVMPGEIEAPLRHRLEGVLCHAAQRLVAEEARGRLDRVLGALGEMQTHRPVIGNGVHDVGQPRVHGRLRGPDVRGDIGNVLRQGARDGRHQLRLLLVGGVIGQLAEALAVFILPEDVEQLRLLAQAGAETVEIVLVADDLAAGGVLEGVEVKPEGGIAQRLCRRGHGHADAVMAEAHADVADDDVLLAEVIGRAADDEVLGAERVEHAVRLGGERIGDLAVVAELAAVALHTLDRLGIVPVRNEVSEDALCSVHHVLSPLYRMLTLYWFFDTLYLNSLLYHNHFCQGGDIHDL